MTADQKGKLQLEAKTQTELDPSSLDDCRRSVLNIIAERAPCPEPKLFITAINSGLECFGGRSLADLRELLGQCVQNLKADGLVEIVENEFVLANTGNAGAEEEDTVDQSSEREQRPFTLEGELTDQDHAEETPKPEEQYAQAAATDEVGDTDEPAKDDMAASAPESAEDGDIFDLTGELELAPEELEESSIDQDHAEAPASDTPETRGGTTDDARHGQEPITEGIDARDIDARDVDARDTDASSPEDAEDADVFDLTDALELVPEEQEDTTIDQDRAEEEPQAGSAATADRQDAAEPTREEIIAAMRQFVSGGKSENSE